MKTRAHSIATGLLPSRRGLVGLAGVGCTFFVAALAVAQSPGPSGAASATASASATGAATGTATAAANGDKPAAGKGGVAVSAYAWPTETSPEPKEEEWARATALETLDGNTKDKPWWTRTSTTCTQRAVREWVRITCTPDASASTSYGVIWGKGGDLSSVKGKLPLRKDLPPDPAFPPNSFDKMTPNMGASATVTFQVKQGSALVLEVDEIFFAQGWDWAGVEARPGYVVDVSWALGEKAPSIQIH